VRASQPRELLLLFVQSGSDSEAGLLASQDVIQPLEHRGLGQPVLGGLARTIIAPHGPGQNDDNGGEADHHYPEKQNPEDYVHAVSMRLLRPHFRSSGHETAPRGLS